MRVLATLFLYSNMNLDSFCNRDASDASSAHGSLDHEYAHEVNIQQFETAVIRQVNRVADHENRRVASKAKLDYIEQCMFSVFDRQTVLFSIDVESWEQDNSYITEIGISIYDPRHQELALVPNIKTSHIIIKENQHLKNGQITPDHSANFSGAVSYIFSKPEARLLIDDLLRHYFDLEFPLRCVLIGHGLDVDIKLLETIGIFVHPKVPRIDTRKVFSHTHGRVSASLKNALTALNQPYSFLFNAGNFSYYATLLAMKLCDPMVRHLIGLDYLKENEIRGKPVNTRKRIINTSRQISVPPEELFQEIIQLNPF